VDGQDQLVCFMASAVVGIDPADGSFVWTFPHRTNWGLNISTPVWGEDNLLFISSAYGSGSDMIRLTKRDGKTIPQKVWSANRMHIHHGTAIRVGDYLYGSSGDFGPAPLTAIEASTGKVAWQDRAFPKANFIYADGKFIVLDEDGTLALANFSPQGLQVLSKVNLLESNAWTAPTLVGKRLFIRDRTSMMALDLP
jgi:outer membrane protein assembly factor BamB